MLRTRIAFVGCAMVVVFVLTSAVVQAAAGDRVKKKVKQSSTEKVDFPAGGKIYINKSFGEVSVEGWDQESVELTVEKAIKATDTPEKQAEAQAKLRRVTIRMVKDQPDSLVIHSEVPFRKDLELKYRIKLPRQSTLFIKHDIGDVEVSNVLGDMHVTARIGDVTIRLPSSEDFNVDARAKIGDVSSEFGGKNNRQWLIGAKTNQATDYKPTAHWVIARIGIGDIQVRKM
jgi:hypothetical protein